MLAGERATRWLLDRAQLSMMPSLSHKWDRFKTFFSILNFSAQVAFRSHLMPAGEPATLLEPLSLTRRSIPCALAASPNHQMHAGELALDQPPLNLRSTRTSSRCSKAWRDKADAPAASPTHLMRAGELVPKESAFWPAEMDRFQCPNNFSCFTVVLNGVINVFLYF